MDPAIEPMKESLDRLNPSIVQEFEQLEGLYEKYEEYRKAKRASLFHNKENVLDDPEPKIIEKQEHLGEMVRLIPGHLEKNVYTLTATHVKDLLDFTDACHKVFRNKYQKASGERLAQLERLIKEADGVRDFLARMLLQAADQGAIELTSQEHTRYHTLMIPK